MENLEITLYIKTPIIFGRYEINLDSLLYWAAFEGSEENHTKAIDILDTALAKRDGIYLSSNLISLQSPLASITSTIVSFPTCFKWSDFNYPLNKKTVMELGGPYRARLTKYEATNVQAIKFYAVGNADIIGYLLDSLGGIGKGNNQGNGEISEIVIEKIPDDLSWFKAKDGTTILHRNLPVSLVKQLPNSKCIIDNKGEAQIKTILPYHLSKPVIGYETGFLREFQQTL